MIQEPPSRGPNQELLRYLLVLLTTPFWLPFLRALWKELQRAMRPDGGLFGRPPSRAETERIQREIAETEEDPVVHEPLAHQRPGQAQRGPTGAGHARGGAAAPVQPRLRRRPGFR